MSKVGKISITKSDINKQITIYLLRGAEIPSSIDEHKVKEPI